MSEAARSHRSDLRVEPYMEPPGAKRSDAAGPLAELAQIVGQDDPFRAMFRPSKSAMRQAPEPAVAEPVRAEAYDHAPAGYQGEEFEYADDHHAGATATLGLRPSQHEDAAWLGNDARAEAWDDGFDPDAPTEAVHDHEGHGHPGYRAESMPIEAPHYVAPPLTPDLWAAPAEHADVSPALADETAAQPKAPRRPLVVLMAVLALTGGGLAATFLARSGSGAVASSGGSAPPTILAASGPTKIKQTDTASDTTPEDADAALLSKNGTSSGGPVRVVNSQEQPIDLAQLPKSAAGQADAAASSSGSPFPEPKKVKTFLVRPDGSLLNQANGAPNQAPSRTAVPQLATGGTDSAPPPPAPVSRPSTPKTGGHAATTPKAPPASIADLSTDDDAAKAQQPASPGARSPATKPVEVADASPTETTATTGPSGNFALQLAASPNEQDARSAFTKLQKKYSELGGFQPTIKKVDNGQKTVYRLRVGNLNQDQAKTLCSKLQASGGSCFVVHN